MAARAGNSKTVASLEMDGEGAVRAKAISASRSGIKYWSRDATLGCGFLASCACACRGVLRGRASAKNPNAIILTVFRFIGFLLESLLRRFKVYLQSSHPVLSV